MKRFPDWRTRLVSYLHHEARSPFVEGQNDCALFAAGAVAAMTGEDYAAPFRGHYRTTRGGLRVLRKAGFGDHVALAAAWLPDVAVAFAQVGDVAVVPGEDGPALGIVQGAMIYALRPEGLALAPLGAATRAFRV